MAPVPVALQHRRAQHQERDHSGPDALRNAVEDYHFVVPMLWYGLIAVLILTRWWSYWSTLL
nr:hypothetical protein [Catenulispora rubra]